MRFRFLCVDLPEDVRFQELDIPDGATVEDALVEYSKLFRLEDSLDKLPESMFLIGKAPAYLTTVLQDNDELTVIRILHGG